MNTIRMQKEETAYIDVWTLDNENESCKLLVYKGVYSS